MAHLGVGLQPSNLLVRGVGISLLPPDHARAVGDDPAFDHRDDHRDRPWVPGGDAHAFLQPCAQGAGASYVEFFRGLPLLVLLLFTYNMALFAPELRFGFPPHFGVAVDTNEFITGFTAAIIGLALHESAFMAEVVRGGLLAVPRGQAEAAMALGMTRRQAMMTVVMPQAIRVIIPATGNLFILLLKATALVAVIGGGDLLTMAQRIYGSNFQVIPLLFVVCFWYLILVFVASGLQRLLERRMARGVAGNAKVKAPKGESL